MTYAVGWVANGVAFLVADSLVTGGDPGGPPGSFSEPPLNDRGDQISESLLKIFPIGRWLAMSFAGNVDLGHRIVDFIAEHLPALQSAPAVFDSLGKSFGPFSAAAAVEVILAGCTPSGEAFVLAWSTDDCKLRRPSRPVQIGSPSDIERLATRHLIEITSRDFKDSQLILGIIVSQLQAYCVQDFLSSRGIGGAFVGLSIGQDGAAWMSDVTYAMVRPHGIDGMVFVRVRDGFLITFSTHRGSTIVVMGNQYSNTDLARWKATWTSELDGLMENPESEFMSFLDLSKRMNALVRRSPKGSWGGHITFERSGRTTRLSIGPEVSAVLSERVERRTGQETFQLFIALTGD